MLECLSGFSWPYLRKWRKHENKLKLEFRHCRKYYSYQGKKHFQHKSRTKQKSYTYKQILLQCIIKLSLAVKVITLPQCKCIHKYMLDANNQKFSKYLQSSYRYFLYSLNIILYVSKMHHCNLQLIRDFQGKGNKKSTKLD